MTSKKTDGGKDKGKSPIRRKRTVTTKNTESSSSVKPAKRTGVGDQVLSWPEHQFPHPDDFHGDIAKRAYELYERRGWSHGQDLNDWLEAEQEILVEKSLVKL